MTDFKPGDEAYWRNDDGGFDAVRVSSIKGDTVLVCDRRVLPRIVYIEDRSRLLPRAYVDNCEALVEALEKIVAVIKLERERECATAALENAEDVLRKVKGEEVKP